MPLVFLLVIAVIFFIFNLAGKTFISLAGWFIRLRNRWELTDAVVERYDGYLRNFSFYMNLDEEDRKRFIIRLAEFMNSKDFVGQEGLGVTEEMRVLISASATQLLFGLDRYVLDHFITIKVYPGIFYSKLMNVHMKGGTTPGGTIMLSWKDFAQGYNDGKDKINLGLHELAHALKVEVEKGDDYSDSFLRSMQRWDNYTRPYMEKAGKGEIPFLRKYAGTNAQEFWAVCIEHFFEAPLEFREQLPEIYKYLCELLRQDPAQRKLLHADSHIAIPAAPPSLGKARVLVPPAGKVLRPTFESDSLLWFCVFLILPVSCGIYGLCQDAVISVGGLAVTIAAFTMIGLIIFGSAWKRGALTTFRYAAQALVLSGMVGTLLLLIINYFTAQYIPLESYRITSVQRQEYRENDLRHTRYIYSLDNGVYENVPRVRTFNSEPKGKFINYHFRQGTFGIKIRYDYFFSDSYFDLEKELEKRLTRTKGSTADDSVQWLLKLGAGGK